MWESLPPGLVASVSALSAFLVTLLSGKLVVPTFAYLREKERADKWEAETMRLNSVIAEKMMPALALSAKANEESAEAVRTAIATFGLTR